MDKISKIGNSDNSQTSVYWLVEKIEQYILTFGNLPFNVVSQFKKQAKAMEKEQIMDAYWNGTTDMEKQDALNDAEKFYNEYYGA